MNFDWNKAFFTALAVITAMMGYGLKQIHADTKANTLELARRSTIINEAGALRAWANDFRIDMAKQITRLESSIMILEDHLENHDHKKR